MNSSIFQDYNDLITFPIVNKEFYLVYLRSTIGIGDLQNKINSDLNIVNLFSALNSVEMINQNYTSSLFINCIICHNQCNVKLNISLSDFSNITRFFEDVIIIMITMIIFSSIMLLVIVKLGSSSLILFLILVIILLQVSLIILIFKQFNIINSRVIEIINKSVMINSRIGNMRVKIYQIESSNDVEL